MVQQTWTKPISDLIETLTCRVRVLSLIHIYAGWTKEFGSRSAVKVALEQLIEADLLVGEVWEAQPSPIGEQPIAAWSPGLPEPDFYEIEQVVRNRWTAQPTPTPVLAATHKAARLFGSSTGGLPPENHRNHDLLLASTYLRYRCVQPEQAANWLGEDAVAMAEKGVKNPDAFLFDNEGALVKVIESAGRYSFKQLESFHQHCQLSTLPYELW